MAEATTELLRDIGLQVVWASGGKSALAMLERDPTIQLVMSDIVMPGGMSGLELAHAMRERHPGVPVLLATGYSQYAPQVVREGFTLVEKPYSREVLAASIRRAAERSRHTLSRAKREPA